MIYPLTPALSPVPGARGKKEKGAKESFWFLLFFLVLFLAFVLDLLLVLFLLALARGNLGVRLHDGVEEAHLAEVEDMLRCGGGEEPHQPGDEAGPTCLMAGAETGAVVAMEILVEQHIVAPVRVGLELLRPAMHRAPP